MSTLPADITAMQSAIHTWMRDASGLADASVNWSQQQIGRPDGPWIAMTVAAVRSFGQDWLDVEDNFITIADQTVVSVTPGSDQLEVTGHPFQDGDGPVSLTTTGTLPAGLAVDTDYFVIVVDGDNIQLADTTQEALAGTQVSITDAGSGTHTVVDTPETVRAGEEVIYHQRGPRHIRLQVQCFEGTPIGSGSPWAILETIRSSDKLPGLRGPLVAAGVGILSFGEILDIGDGSGASEFDPRAVMDVMLSVAAQVSQAYTYIEFAEMMNLINGGTIYVPSTPP